VAPVVGVVVPPVIDVVAPVVPLPGSPPARAAEPVTPQVSPAVQRLVASLPQVVVQGSVHSGTIPSGSTAAAEVAVSAASRPPLPVVAVTGVDPAPESPQGDSAFVSHGPVSASSGSGAALGTAGNALLAGLGSGNGDAPANRRGPRPVPGPAAPAPSGSWDSLLSGGLAGGPPLLLFGVLSAALLLVALRRSRARFDVFGCPQTFLAVLERPG
jgi:hypothetical protein